MPVFYSALVLITGTLFDYQPEDKIELTIDSEKDMVAIQDSILSFMTWNIGYAGLGAKSNFFYDNGGFYHAGDKTVTEDEEQIDEYFNGILDFINKNKVDFWMLQEVDRGSKRSHYKDEFLDIKDALKDYANSYATNFRNSRVPIPLFEPWNIIGSVESGIANLSKYTPSSAMRCQLPGEYPWPDRIFHLDRCALLQRYPLPNGKELVVVNTHNSAFDQGGVLKKQQLRYLDTLLTAEYSKGNYVIVGGDWNQGPNVQGNQINIDTNYTVKSPDAIPDTFLTSWPCVSDYTIPTNRSVTTIYEPKSTPVQIIDFFYISPNIKLKTIKSIDLQFQYSDHQPVYMEVVLF